MTTPLDTALPGSTAELEWADDPLANAVYSWVALPEQAVEEGTLVPLIAAFGALAVPAPPLWRGLDGSWPAPGPGGVWQVDDTAGPRAAFTSRPEYARLWAEQVLLEVHGATGVSLPRLLDVHPGFAEPVTDAGRARLYHNDLTLYERIRNEQEWLLRGSFRVEDVTEDDGLQVVRLAPLRD